MPRAARDLVRDDDHKTIGWILTVGPDQAVLEGVVARLCQAGLRACGTTRGAQALCLIAACRPTLVVIDHHSEDMAGPELAQSVRQLDDRVHVIMLGDGAAEEREARQAGVLHYVSSPVDWQRLQALASRIVALQGGTPATPLSQGVRTDE